MNYSVFRFTLNMHSHRSQVSVPVFVGDIGVRLLISITDGGNPYFIEDGCTAMLRGKKPDGNPIFNQCIILNNTTIQYDFTKQTSNVEGIVTCEIDLYGADGTPITAPKFIIVVDSRAVSDADIDEAISVADIDIIPTLMATKASEETRTESEQARVEAEKKRATAETNRATAEDKRDVNEARRVEAEEKRVASETERVEAERQRVTAEAERISLEEALSLTDSIYASAEVAKDAANRVGNLKSSITKNSKRITNLEQGIIPSPFETDSDVAYIKTVPENALPYAAISKIGGMTHKDGETLKDAKVTGIKSVGTNIWDEQWEVGFIQPSNGQNASSDVRIRSKNYSFCQSDTQYYVLGILDDEIIVFEYDANKAFIKATYLWQNKFTTSNTTRYIRFLLNANYGIVYKNDICINVSNDTINGTYYPYTENTFAIPEALQNLEGYGLGLRNTLYNYIDFESKSIIKRVARYICTGNESWTEWGSTETERKVWINVVDGSSKDNGDIKSNQKFEHTSDTTKPYRVDLLSGNTKIVYAMPVSEYTLDSWKAQLQEWYNAGEPLYFDYELKTPTTESIDITDDNLIYVESGGTLTFVNEYELDVPSEVTYQIKEVAV
ncbi:MAG: BppU family phage baseplate upper protein [Clostridia bacterium]|nr:BppU family phage baseplate upper protein [Clostridia bacterium]